VKCRWYGDGAGNTSDENSSVFSLIQCASCCQRGYAGSKTLLRQNPPVLTWGCWNCWLMQVVLYNGCRMVAVVVVGVVKYT